MGSKRKTLPKEICELLKTGDVGALKVMFARCEPNARYLKDGNVFCLAFLPREFAFWAKERGADIDFRNELGETALMCHAGDERGNVQLLLDLGADPNAQAPDGWTALHYAAVNGRTASVQALLKAGAEVDAETGESDKNRTPLEMMLRQGKLELSQYLEIASILSDAGARLTDDARRSLQACILGYQMKKRDSTDENSDYFRRQEEALPGLCAIFGVEISEEIPFHDGVSPIVINEIEYHDQFRRLWSYLIPPSGRAATAQGEALRIAGRVDDELMRNGGENWDENYEKMLDIFPEYLALGNPLSQEELSEASLTALVLKIRKNHLIDDGTSSQLLCKLAVKWILQNPEVLPLLEADYTR